MHPTPPSQAQSPPFGYLSSPPFNDSFSDDGDSLRTPLTEQHHPYAVYQQERHPFNFGFHTFPNPPHSDTFADGAKQDTGQSSSFTSFSALLTPSASEKLPQDGKHLDGFYPFSSPPSNALDLANASLEFNPFAASFSSYNESPTEQDTATNLPSSSLIPGPSSTELASDLMPLPSLSVSINSLGDIHDDSNSTSLLFSPQTHPPILKPSYPQCHFFDQGRMFSQRFPPEHTLNPYFVRTYQLGDELGAGGYGFVMTAWHRTGQFEVAVKFIIKDKVPEHAWWEDDMLGRIPTEVMVLSLISHDNIVKCLDLFEDDVYFYMVQELHGTPWVSRKSKKNKQISAPGKLIPVPSPALSTPSLTPSPSTESNTDSLPSTPPQVFVEFADCFSSKDDQQSPRTPPEVDPKDNSSTSVSVEEQKSPVEPYLRPASALEAIPRPNFSRRASYDLFECIEQSKHKRLSENQARYIFAQVVDAVRYLNSQGITHCDIKDENLVIDSELKVKLIDFGSAIVADPSQPPPYHTLFFGTTAYAASEILLKKPYRAPPAEIWTLGVLLSYLLTGHSPFPTEQDAINGRVVIRDKGGKISKAALNILERCLVKDPTLRADIDEIRSHRWLEGALDRGAGSLGSTLR